MRPHHDYVLVGRRTALTRDFAALLDDFLTALKRLDRQPSRPQRARAATRSNDETLNDDR
jgi:ribonuclease P protein component